MFLPFQGGGQEGDRVSVGVVLNLPYRKINGTLKKPARAGIQKRLYSPRIKYGAGPERHAVQSRLSQARNDRPHDWSLFGYCSLVLGIYIP